MKDCSDNKQIEIQLLDGDIKAFEAFYKTYFAELWSFATHYVMSKEIARDIVQDSFVMLLEKRKNIEPSQSLKGYLYVTIKHKCFNHLRSYKIADANKERLIEALVFSDIDDQSQEVIEKVRKCKEQLSEQQRKVISLKIEGKNYAQIAQELGIAESTVNVHIKKAYKFFRDNMLILIVLRNLFKNIPF